MWRTLYTASVAKNLVHVQPPNDEILIAQDWDSDTQRNTWVGGQGQNNIPFFFVAGHIIKLMNLHPELI